ncbi:MAG: phosphopantothenoylcysteine decarboxylase [Candidatus Omnitrophica bacterium]|nr:phosphopantothenoylcysteine decarboxylase [Candidatus Omnitrophota bacterium]
MSLKNKKILITSGPTWVPLDPVRVISNRSTGELGKLLTKACQKAGGKVTLLEGPVQEPLKSSSVRIRKFCFFDELKKLLKEELKKSYDVVIHAAAVADYRLEKPLQEKIGSYRETWQLTLIPTEKLILKIKRLSPKSFLVGFKLETTATKDQLFRVSRGLMESAHCDLVVANSFQGGYHAYLLGEDEDVILGQAKSRPELVQKLIKTLTSAL